MSLYMFLEVVLASKRFLTNRTGEGSESGVDPSVTGKFLVPSEGFSATVVFAGEGSFPGVNTNVTLELSVVGEANIAVRALELFRSLH